MSALAAVDYETRMQAEFADRRRRGDEAEAVLTAVAVALNAEVCFRPRTEKVNAEMVWGTFRVTHPKRDDFLISFTANHYGMAGRVAFSPASITTAQGSFSVRDFLPREVDIPSTTASLAKAPALIANGVRSRVIVPFRAMWPGIAAAIAARETSINAVTANRAAYEDRANRIEGVHVQYIEADRITMRMCLSPEDADRVLALLEARS